MNISENLLRREKLFKARWLSNTMNKCRQLEQRWLEELRELIFDPHHSIYLGNEKRRLRQQLKRSIQWTLFASEAKLNYVLRVFILQEEYRQVDVHGRIYIIIKRHPKRTNKRFRSTTTRLFSSLEEKLSKSHNVSESKTEPINLNRQFIRVRACNFKINTRHRKGSWMTNQEHSLNDEYSPQ